MVTPLETHASVFLTVLSQAPKVFTVRGVPRGGVRELTCLGPHDLHGAMGHMTSLAQPHLSGVQQRELLCSESCAVKSWDPMVVETWIEVLIEKLKYI
jgi:predicted short-subunit dehydrogenase-like oxidoreductase (DUF2520 family)